MLPTLFFQNFIIVEGEEKKKYMLHCSKDKHRDGSEPIKRCTEGAEIRLHSQCITNR